jgi:aerobic carbon-monoxide dehydrogenase small subunit
MKQVIRLRVNGEEHEALVKPNMTLLDFLRNGLGLTGTKKGCDEGDCGACTVLLDGKPVNSCLVLALEANGKDVLTIEGLSQGGELHPLQRAFIEKGAVQCGYCSPGMLLSAKALLSENPTPTEHEVRSAISGNLCRCTGYVKIVEAILAAAKKCDGRAK